MSFSIILYKKYYEKSEVFIKDMVRFETKQDLENFKNQGFSLVFSGSNCNFLFEADSIERSSLFFLSQEDIAKISLRDHRGKQYFLSDIWLMHKSSSGVHAFFNSKLEEYIRVPTIFDAIPIEKLFNSEEFLNHPPGTIRQLSSHIYLYNNNPCNYPPNKKDFYVEIQNFQPDEHVAFISRTIDDNKISSYSFISPWTIQEELQVNGRIYFLNIKDQLTPIPDDPGGKGRGEFVGYYDKLYLTLPSLFSQQSEFEMIEYRDEEEKESSVEYKWKHQYFQNPALFFDIYINEEARSAWLNKELSSPFRTQSYQALLEKSQAIDFFHTVTEHYPLRFKHNPDKDILAHSTIRRDRYDDEHFIHLSPHTNDTPRPISLYEALPEDLQVKFHNSQFCLIQYNASQTVPDKERTGYSSFKGEKLEPGRIHRSFLSIEDLKATKLHPEYGGSYYVLAACTHDYMQKRQVDQKPELWTIFTEGKEWRTLQDKQGKWFAYPYKINY